MLAVFACTPNQLQQNQEYDDVYFTASDRAKKPTIVQNPEEVISSNQKALVTSDFSNESVDAQLVSKYNNGVEDEVVYFQEARVTKPSELNYDDFVYDYENNHLAYYELPLDWQTDWDRNSFNQLVNFDFQFQLAWYDQYYLGSNARMNNYLTNSSRRLSRSFNAFGPRVGFDIGFSSFGFGISPFFGFGMRAVNLNPYGFYDPFFDPFWGYSSFGGGFYNSYYSSIGFGRPWGWNNFGGWNRFGGFNNYYASNVIFINNSDLGNADRRTVTRGGRVSSTSVSSVRTDAINGTSPSTRSGRLASTSPNSRSSRISSSSFNDVSRGSRASSTGVAPSRSSRVSTNAYQFSGSPSSTRSSSVRNNSVRNTSTVGRSSTLNTSSARSSSNLFSRSSSSRTVTPNYSRSSSSRNSSFNNSRSSSSRSSGFSSGRSNSSSSRSSGSIGSSSSRSSSSSSSRSSGSSSSSSRSSSSSSSSRSGRGN